jgi:hypothetical protein
MFKRLIALIVLIGVIAGLVLLVQTNQTARDVATLTRRTTDKKVTELFKVTATEFYADSYNISHLYGEVRNQSDTRAKQVVVEIKLYDKDENLKKKLTVTVKDVPSNQVRSFDISLGTYKEAYRPEARVVEVAY